MLQFVKNRAENVGLVIGNFRVGEVGQVLRALNDAGDALKAHAGVHVPGGQRRERAVRVRVELNENEIPDFDAARVALVHQIAFGVAFWREINVQFRARTARAGSAHHPEIVLLAAVDDVDFRVEADDAEFFSPAIPSFLVKFAGIVLGFVRRINRRVKPRRRKFPFLDDQFPRPFDGLLFEIIAEAPVAEHLEKRVVIGVEADVFEVVVLAAGADALLGVGGAARRVRTFCLAEKNRDELVHAGVREQEVRRIGHEARRRHDGVLLRFEEIEKRLANLCGCHHLKLEKSVMEVFRAGERKF